MAATASRETRTLMAHAYIEGNSLLMATAKTSISPYKKPEFEAQAALHQLINDGITGFGGRELREVMLGFNGIPEEFVPAIQMSIPKHDKDGNKILGPDGITQQVHSFHLPLPITFLSEELTAHGFSNLAKILRKNSGQLLTLAPDQSADLTRLVAYRLSDPERHSLGEYWDHGPVQNYLLAEKAVNTAFAGPYYKIPRAA